MKYRPGHYEDLIAKAKSEDYLIVIMQEVSDNSDISDAYWSTLCKLADEVLQQFRGPNYCICKTHDNRVYVIREPLKGIATRTEEPKLSLDVVSTILRFQRVHRHDYTLRVEDAKKDHLKGCIQFTLIDMDDDKMSYVVTQDQISNGMKTQNSLDDLLIKFKAYKRPLIAERNIDFMINFRKNFPLVARGQHKTGPVGIDEINLDEILDNFVPGPIIIPQEHEHQINIPKEDK